LIDKLPKSFNETLIADLETGADVFGRARLGRLAEQGEDLIRKRIALRRLTVPLAA
jgi:hypothetical protein